MAASAFAQTSPSPDLFRSAGASVGLDEGAAVSPNPASGGKKDDKDAKDGQPPKPAGPTVITSTGDMTYDERTHLAIFTGPNYGVFVQDPQFTVNCDKLTAYMRHAPAPGLPGTAAAPAAGKGKGKGIAAAVGAKPSPVVAKSSPAAKAAPGAKTPGGKAAKDADKAGGLQRAVAEGDADHPIVIKQEKPAANGGEPETDVGIAQKADYNADTGDIVLTGWPRVSQGINTQIATSEGTTMTMNRNTNTMKTTGPSRTVIEEKAAPSPKPSAEESSTPRASL